MKRTDKQLVKVAVDIAKFHNDDEFIDGALDELTTALSRNELNRLLVALDYNLVLDDTILTYYSAAIRCEDTKARDSIYCDVISGLQFIMDSGTDTAEEIIEMIKEVTTDEQ